MQFKATDKSTIETLKEIRKLTNLSQEEFAKSVGSKKNTIQNYEQGRRNYTFKTLQNYCKIHNIDIIIKNKEK